MSDLVAAPAFDPQFPGSITEFTTRYPDDAACADLLRRWKYGGAGFRCPGCGGTECWFLPSRRLDECRTCHRQVSLTAGTVMHGTRRPLRHWFLAIFLFVHSKQGISAAELQRSLGLRSYQTAWAWLHKLRDSVASREMAKLSGVVEADETYEVGVRPGSGGGRPTVSSKASLIVGAIEVPPDRRGFGRLRLASLEAATAIEIGRFLEQNVEDGSTLKTDGFMSYKAAAIESRYHHVTIPVKPSGRPAHEILPGIHRIFALLDRVLKTTHQGAVRRKHLNAYLGEFAFRFNRRNSKSRGRLFLAALLNATRRAPRPYWRLIGRITPSTPLGAAA